MAFSIAYISLRLFYSRLGTFLAANVLWLLTSLPLVTLPAATGALFYLVQRVIAEERDLVPESASIQDFWVGWRLHWRRSLLVGYLNLFALAVVTLTLLFYWRSEQEYLLWLVGPVSIVLLILVGMQLYLYPLLINRPELSIGDIFRHAFVELLRSPMDSYLILSWLFILIIVCTALGGPVLLILFSLIAVVQSMALRVFRIKRGELPPAKVNKDAAG